MTPAFLFFLVVLIPGAEPRPQQFPMETKEACLEAVDTAMSLEIEGDIPRGALIDARCIRRFPPSVSN